ncbi:uncharacterized protein EI97DRAFT_370045 [Westerdykella ornata]|uniref:Uncharacterized protein n=1 Tax=Westerdykella ornata TaxID=318751 RepID=A0A6A6JTI3_WESOR|nr:uncharacterized protein EI97DRAFT_370045 [Westerdykella ornata]KAF2279921.1 hypothetical protein EI97DRAFT_370045 [Westerdykella ornata]
MQSFRKPYARKILIATSIIVVPMIAFTIAIIWAVFAKKLDRATCPYPEICPGPELLNVTSNANYYVDFDAGRLAFISSLSATISFALVSILMMIYAYSAASQLLRSSDDSDQRTALPSPYQVSLLLRVLNAEILALGELCWEKVKRVFWKREKAEKLPSEERSSYALQRSIGILALCITASILIQVADTYFHIAITSTPFVQVISRDVAEHHYSRHLAPWCINRPGAGVMNNKNFWSCSLNRAPETGAFSLANNSLVNDYVLGPMQDYHLNYTGEDGAQFGIVGVPQAPQEMDWKATSFAVSTHCSAMPRYSCDLGEELNMQTFNCTKDRSGVDLDGRLTGYTAQEYYFDVHKYLKHKAAFYDTDLVGIEHVNTTAYNITDEGADEIFANPWHWITVLSVTSDDEKRQKTFSEDNRVWPKYTGGLDHMWLLCNSTVWDVTYTVVGHTVTSLKKRKSNGTMAGIASMSSFPIAFFGAELSMAVVAAGTANDPDGFIETYARETSKIYTRMLAAMTVTQPASLAQLRVSKIVTKLPVSALWILVVANMSFVALAFGLTILALMSASEDVYQVHTRLSITGLAAALFENSHAEKAVKSDSELFEESCPAKDRPLRKVGVRRTDTGGSSFHVMEV